MEKELVRANKILSDKLNEAEKKLNHYRHVEERIFTLQKEFDYLKRSKTTVSRVETESVDGISYVREIVRVENTPDGFYVVIKETT